MQALRDIVLDKKLLKSFSDILGKMNLYISKLCLTVNVTKYVTSLGTLGNWNPTIATGLCMFQIDLDFCKY